jgi:uncharacterized protein YndB with AHSA1/START domain
MKKLLTILAVLVVAVLIVAAVLPKDFKIEKEITINKPVSEVFNYLKISQNANNWNPWIKKDPNLTQEYKGVDGTVGHISSWSSKNREVGVGEEEITNIIDNQKIEFEIRFKEPMTATNKGSFVTESVGENQTKVVWSMTGRTPFPFNLMCFFMRGKVADEFAKGLEDLKNVLENPASITLETAAEKSAPAAENADQTATQVEAK